LQLHHGFWKLESIDKRLPSWILEEE
jgi:hypothetical protein